jgi:transposase, IS30 family
MTAYKQLTFTQKYTLQGLFQSGSNNKSAAKLLKVSESTISRELARNGLNAKSRSLYRASTICNANVEVNGGGSARRRRVLIPPLSQRYILSKLKCNYSPEQIVNTWECLGKKPCVSWVYAYIAAEYYSGKNYYQHLRILKIPKSRKKAGAITTKGKIPNRTDISERPQFINDRSEFGHWEGDLVHIGDGYLVTLNERVTRKILTSFVKTKNSKIVCKKIINKLKHIKNDVKSITFDNGLEFARHDLIHKALNAKIYFCKPYHSWERGANENGNGLIRQFFIKGKVYSDVSQRETKKVEKNLNNRPRKVLNYQNPNTIYLSLTSYKNCG